MDIDPRLLRIFVAVLRCGSVTRAAEELHTTQPSVSKALDRLEGAVGFKLFEKRGRGLHPTARAQLIQEAAARVERELEAVHRQVSEMRRDREFGFSVATVPTFATTLLPRAIVKLRCARPKATLKVEIWRRERILAELDAGRIDIGLIHSPTEHVPSGFRIIADAPVQCIMPPGHPLAAASVVTATDLRGQKLVTYHNTVDFADALWRMIDEIDPPPQIVVEATQSGLIRDLVRHGVGIALLDGFTATDPTLTDMVMRPFRPVQHFHLAVGNRSKYLGKDADTFLSILESVASSFGKPVAAGKDDRTTRGA